MAYINDEGFLMEYTDFIQYVLWLVKQGKDNNDDWKQFLTPNFWGDQLLAPEVLKQVKELIK